MFGKQRRKPTYSKFYILLCILDYRVNDWCIYAWIAAPVAVLGTVRGSVRPLRSPSPKLISPRPFFRFRALFLLLSSFFESWCAPGPARRQPPCHVGQTAAKAAGPRPLGSCWRAPVGGEAADHIAAHLLQLQVLFAVLPRLHHRLDASVCVSSCFGSLISSCFGSAPQTESQRKQTSGN